MKSTFACRTCISRFKESGFRSHGPNYSPANARWHQTSTQFRRLEPSASTATANAKEEKTPTQTPMAKPRNHPKEAPPTPPYHLTPNLPYPQHDLSSTRPAHLSLPTYPHQEVDGTITSRSRISHLYALGKSYLSFYKTGFSNIWRNQKEYRDLRRRISGTNINDSIRHGSSPPISRREFQLCLRTRHDLKKLVPFGLVFAVCGEFTPLVIPALGMSVAPYTCRIPQQIRKDLRKMLSRIEKVERLQRQKETHDSTAVDRKNRALAYIHTLDPFGLSTIRPIPLLTPLLWRFYTLPRLHTYLDNIICDALLILKEGGVSRLETEEVFDFAIKIGHVDTIRQLADYYEKGRQLGMMKEEEKEVEKVMRVVGLFVDGVKEVLQGRQKEEVGAGGQYSPDEVFVAAAQRAKGWVVGGITCRGLRSARAR